MKKLLIVLLVLVIAFLVVFVFGNREEEDAGFFSPEPTPTPELTISPTPEEGTSQDIPQTYIVKLTDDAFMPSSLTIKVGDTILFINDGTKNHWPASGVHPVHAICSGFDSKKPVAPGDSYSYTFNEAKTCPMHDHLNPSVGGEIVVETR